VRFPYFYRNFLTIHLKYFEGYGGCVPHGDKTARHQLTYAASPPLHFPTENISRPEGKPARHAQGRRSRLSRYSNSRAQARWRPRRARRKAALWRAQTERGWCGPQRSEDTAPCSRAHQSETEDSARRGPAKPQRTEMNLAASYASRTGPVSTMRSSGEARRKKAGREGPA
jgi:hypothetical protein